MLTPLVTEKVHTVESKLMCFLWLMGNMESFHSVADRFGLSKSSLHLSITHVTDALLHLALQHIVFHVTQLHAISRTFDKFPEVYAAGTGH